MSEDHRRALRQASHWFFGIFLLISLVPYVLPFLGIPILGSPEQWMYGGALASSLRHGFHNFLAPTTGKVLAMGDWINGSNPFGRSSASVASATRSSNSLGAIGVPKIDNGADKVLDRRFGEANFNELDRMFRSPLVDNAAINFVSNECGFKRVSLPTKSAPAAFPQSVFDVLRFILWNPRSALTFGDSVSLDFVYFTQKDLPPKLIAIYPSPNCHPDQQLNLFVNVALYGFSPPHDLGNIAHWEKAIKEFRDEYNPLKAQMALYEMQRRESQDWEKRDEHGGEAFNDCVWRDYQNYPFFVAFFSSDSARSALFTLPLDPRFDSGEIIGYSISSWRNQFHNFHDIVRPLFPTVYDSPLNIRADRDFLMRINKETRSGERVLLIGPGPALDEWLVSLKNPADITVFGINPFEVASSRQLRQIQIRGGEPFQGDAVDVLGNQTLLPDGSHDLIVWGMPWWDDKGEIRDMRDYHDGTLNGAKALRAMVSNFSRIMSSRGRVLLWNRGSRDVKNQIEEAINLFNLQRNDKLKWEFFPVDSQWGVYRIFFEPKNGGDLNLEEMVPPGETRDLQRILLGGPAGSLQVGHLNADVESIRALVHGERLRAQSARESLEHALGHWDMRGADGHLSEFAVLQAGQSLGRYVRQAEQSTEGSSVMARRLVLTALVSLGEELTGESREKWNLWATLFAQGFNENLYEAGEKVLSSVRSQRRLMMEVSETLLSGKPTEEDQTRLAEWVVLANHVGEIREDQLEWVLPNETSTLGDLMEKYPVLAPLLERNAKRWVKTNFLGEHGKYSVKKLLLESQGKGKAGDLSPVDLYLVSRDEWELESDLPDGVARILIAIVGGLVYDATVKVGADLKRLFYLRISA